MPGPDRHRHFLSDVRFLVCTVLYVFASACDDGAADRSVVLRVATFNVEDIRTDDLRRTDHPRLSRIAAIIQELRPHVILINEIAYDQEGVAGYDALTGPGQNGRRLADAYLAVAQRPERDPVTYQAVMTPSNTGLASGFDLDNNGVAVTDPPQVPSAGPDGAPAPQTQEGRAYGNDSWGFGMFPGQYAMTLLVVDTLTVLHDRIRTFQHFRWSQMPGALRPEDPETGRFWYSDAEWNEMRLSSKTHIDVPVEMPNGATIHFLCSHPTPPAFDGAEKRNRLRNHDEIRFWHDYLSGAGYIVDDQGTSGGFTGGSFVVMGDLNADPDEGDSIGNPIKNLLYSAPNMSSTFVPQAVMTQEALDDDDTSAWGLRIDYVLPSMDLEVTGGSVYRYDADEGPASDHFPVWVDLVVPAPGDG